MLYILLLLTILIPSGHALAESILGHPQSGPAPPAKAWTQTGKASIYHRKYIKRKTASGAEYNPDLLTAAHRSLPLGTVVRVKCLDNGKSIEVVVNDRFGKSAPKKTVIDLSFAAAKAIGLTKKQGTCKVRLEIVSMTKEDR